MAQTAEGNRQETGFAKLVQLRFLIGDLQPENRRWCAMLTTGNWQFHQTEREISIHLSLHWSRPSQGKRTRNLYDRFGIPDYCRERPVLKIVAVGNGHVAGIRCANLTVRYGV